MSGLEAVLASHAPRLTWVGTADWTAECLAADCDWREHGAKGGGVAASDAHRTHLAATIRAWVHDRMAEAWQRGQRPILAAREAALRERIAAAIETMCDQSEATSHKCPTLFAAHDAAKIARETP